MEILKKQMDCEIGRMLVAIDNRLGIPEETTKPTEPTAENPKKRSRPEEVEEKGKTVTEPPAKLAKVADQSCPKPVEPLRSTFVTLCSMTELHEHVRLQQDEEEEVKFINDAVQMLLLGNPKYDTLDRAQKFAFLFYHRGAEKLDFANCVKLACEGGAYQCLPLILDDTRVAALSLSRNKMCELFINLHDSIILMDRRGCPMKYWACLAIMAADSRCTAAVESVTSRGKGVFPSPRAMKDFLLPFM
jgi:hypothetical protein